MRVLVVCGYSMRGWSATYDAVRRHFVERGDEAEYFTYTSNESAESVYARLSGVLSGSFDALVAHSMGAALVARYVTRHADAVASYGRVVLCMPLLATQPLLSSLAPHAALCSMQQLAHVYRHWLDRTDVIDAVALLERPTVHVLYALRETLTPMPWRVLSRAANLHVVHGGHYAAYDESAAYAAQFFAALDAALG
jgi:pimeloyl-ACP methyl ester carboxylesterase